MNTSFSLTFNSFKTINDCRVTYLNEHINKPPEVLIELVPLGLWNLKQFGDVEEQLTLLVFCKDLSLVKQENHLVQKSNALFLLQCLVIKDI